jgi:hypothetical protein
VDLVRIKVVIETEAEFKIRSLEFLGQRWIRRGSRNATPGCAIEGDVPGGELEDHLLDATVGIDLESDAHPALLVERRPADSGMIGIQLR